MPMIRFCRLCGTEVESRVPPLEDRPRPVCPECGYVDYVNPINVVGTVPVWGEDGGSVLLCRRNIEPRYGYWTLPAGFLEYGESTAAGAERETQEEAGARVDLLGLFTVLDVVHVGQVHLFYRARLRDLDLEPGPETIEARMFRVTQLPWDDLAFLTTKRTLEHYCADLAAGSFQVHTGVVERHRPSPD